MSVVTGPESPDGDAPRGSRMTAVIRPSLVPHELHEEDFSSSGFDTEKSDRMDDNLSAQVSTMALHSPGAAPSLTLSHTQGLLTPQQASPEIPVHKSQQGVRPISGSSFGKLPSLTGPGVDANTTESGGAGYSPPSTAGLDQRGVKKAGWNQRSGPEGLGESQSSLAGDTHSNQASPGIPAQRATSDEIGAQAVSMFTSIRSGARQEGRASSSGHRASGVEDRGWRGIESSPPGPGGTVGSPADYSSGAWYPDPTGQSPSGDPSPGQEKSTSLASPDLCTISASSPDAAQGLESAGTAGASLPGFRSVPLANSPSPELAADFSGEMREGGLSLLSTGVDLMQHSGEGPAALMGSGPRGGPGATAGGSNLRIPYRIFETPSLFDTDPAGPEGGSGAHLAGETGSLRQTPSNNLLTIHSFPLLPEGSPRVAEGGAGPEEAEGVQGGGGVPGVPGPWGPPSAMPRLPSMGTLSETGAATARSTLATSDVVGSGHGNSRAHPALGGPSMGGESSTGLGLVEEQPSARSAVRSSLGTGASQLSGHHQDSRASTNVKRRGSGRSAGANTGRAGDRVGFRLNGEEVAVLDEHKHSDDTAREVEGSGAWPLMQQVRRAEASTTSSTVSTHQRVVTGAAPLRHRRAGENPTGSRPRSHRSSSQRAVPAAEVHWGEHAAVRGTTGRYTLDSLDRCDSLSSLEPRKEERMDPAERTKKWLLESVSTPPDPEPLMALEGVSTPTVTVTPSGTRGSFATSTSKPPRRSGLFRLCSCFR
eukprot:jgi/Botrbrau1/12881/Bobra.0299s0001.1